MRTQIFRNWLNKISELTPSQRQQTTERLHCVFGAESIASITEGIVPICPHCHNTPCGRWGNAHGLPRYRCKNCGKTFNALTKTPLAHLRHREVWQECADAMIAGDSVRKTAVRCKVDKNTIFRWRHRFLKMLALDKPSCLHGIVEADETYFLESFKGSRHLPRSPRKRGGKATKRGLSAEQIPVLIARDRAQTTTDAVLCRASTQALYTVLEPILDRDVVICSDSSPIYAALAKKLHIAHKPVNINAGIRVTNHAYHIQNVNAYGSRLKAWMVHFHGVATKYLPNYLGWRCCLERFSTQLTSSRFLIQAIGQVVNT